MRRGLLHPGGYVSLRFSRPDEGNLTGDCAQAQDNVRRSMEQRSVPASSHTLPALSAGLAAHLFGYCAKLFRDYWPLRLSSVVHVCSPLLVGGSFNRSCGYPAICVQRLRPMLFPFVLCVCAAAERVMLIEVGVPGGYGESFKVTWWVCS